MSFLDLQSQMPADLKALYQLRADWTRTLSNFRAYRNLWKCSVLNGGTEDEQASDLAESCFQQLRKIKKALTKMHRDMQFSAAEDEAFEIPWDEYREQIEIGEAPQEAARMPDDIKKMLASVLEPDWEKDEHS